MNAVPAPLLNLPLATTMALKAPSHPVVLTTITAIAQGSYPISGIPMEDTLRAVRSDAVLSSM
jgi:hypothetical protein